MNRHTAPNSNACRWVVCAQRDADINRARGMLRCMRLRLMRRRRSERNLETLGVRTRIFARGDRSCESSKGEDQSSLHGGGSLARRSGLGGGFWCAEVVVGWARETASFIFLGGRRMSPFHCMLDF